MSERSALYLYQPNRLFNDQGFYNDTDQGPIPQRLPKFLLKLNLKFLKKLKILKI